MGNTNVTQRIVQTNFTLSSVHLE